MYVVKDGDWPHAYYQRVWQRSPVTGHGPESGRSATEMCVCVYVRVCMYICMCVCVYIYIYISPPHVPYGLRGLPYRLGPKCNRLLSLGSPWGAVTLSRWGRWWFMNMKYQEGPLNLNSTKLPRPWSQWGSSPSRKNPHGRTGNRTRDLMISSQKLWPLDHEAGRIYIRYAF
jgi:hypothetical protein